MNDTNGKLTLRITGWSRWFQATRPISCGMCGHRPDPGDNIRYVRTSLENFIVCDECGLAGDSPEFY